ncbi:GntR family transcriptional regulator [Falsiroseomonas selenitidurans]|uniref:GntR family transcriptional regulator n=1 Tax=Falsiroseomonas selenitidurans TaxID=2716335 RepID=A0ABX1E301_9PROT|nr:GntR family transcriptional regulator [Falsiroseomonas selenitidurans]NKC31466.1 GntR family transcriptional regulator [Falsiroseomonas selenitidurans]
MPSETAQELCLAHLREAILSGRLAPGERIRPEAVAAELGLSRMPVREALHQLEAEGLVTLRPNRGAVVVQLAAAEVQEIYEMRALLEGLCARHAARRATPADIEELDAAVQAMLRVAGDPARWVDRHEAFHDRLCLLGGRLRAAAEARRLRLLLRPLLRSFAAEERDPETLGHEHDVIVDALRDRDARRAERLVVAHVNANAVSVLRGAAPAPRLPARAR